MANIVKAQTDFAVELDSKRKQLFSALQGTGMSVTKFQTSVMNLVRSNPRLLDCDRYSLFNSIRESASLGLSLEPNLGEASIVPFKKMAKLVPGYRGLIKLVTKSGHVSHMQARIFYTNEFEQGYFSYEEGTNPKIEHKPLPPSDRGEKMGAYSVAHLSSGEVSHDLMWLEDIEKIRKQAPGSASQDSAWHTNTDEMWRKTVVRRHIKYLNISSDMGDAVKTAVTDEYFDAGIMHEPIPMPKATKEVEEPEMDAEVVEEEKPKRGRPKKEEPKDSQNNKEEPVGELFNDKEMTIRASIRELGEALGKTEEEINEALNGDVEKERSRMIKEYNEKINKA